MPLWAPLFEEATFSKLGPYNVASIVKLGVDIVVVERAERHIAYLAETAPLMPSPTTDRPSALKDAKADPGDVATTLSLSKNGPYIVLEGLVDSGIESDESDILVCVEDTRGRQTWYQAFWRSVSDQGDEGDEGDEAGAASDEAGSTVSDFGYQVNIEAKSVRDGAVDISVYAVSDEGPVCAGRFADRDLKDLLK